VTTPLSNRAHTPGRPPSPAENAVVREVSSSGIRFYVFGELSEHRARLFRQRVDDDLHDGHRLFSIDLGGTRSLDSGALGILVSISRRVREAEGMLELESVPDHVRLLLQLARLENVFAIREPQRTSRRTPTSSSVIPFGQRRKT
jgi:anti-anti-sigma factor